MEINIAASMRFSLLMRTSPVRELMQTQALHSNCRLHRQPASQFCVNLLLARVPLLAGHPDNLKAGARLSTAKYHSLSSHAPCNHTWPSPFVACVQKGNRLCYDLFLSFVFSKIWATLSNLTMELDQSCFKPFLYCTEGTVQQFDGRTGEEA
jgi:hypothetical protein